MGLLLLGTLEDGQLELGTLDEGTDEDGALELGADDVGVVDGTELGILLGTDDGKLLGTELGAPVGAAVGLHIAKPSTVFSVVEILSVPVVHFTVPTFVYIARFPSFNIFNIQLSED